MRVLVLLTDLFDAIGGIQTFNRCLVKALDEIAHEKGWKVTILVLNDSGNNPLASKYLGLSKYKCSNKNKLLFIFMTLFASFKADVIFFGHVNFSPLAVLLRLVFHRLKMFLVVYGVDVWRRFPIIHALGINSMNKVLSISVESQRQLQQFNKLDQSKMIIVPCTLDPFYCPVSVESNREKLKLPHGKMMLTVSRLYSGDNYKNIDKVIEAMPHVVKEIPDAFYVVAGDGSDRNRLEKLTNETGVKNNVIFTGFVRAELLPFYYKACDVFVLPSVGEGFGIVFLEAMYFSKPCIGAKAGGVPEVVEDGKTGFLVEENDKNFLADKIIKLLKDENLRQTMGEAGKKRFEEEFSFDKFKERLKEVLCH